MLEERAQHSKPRFGLTILTLFLRAPYKEKKATASETAVQRPPPLPRLQPRLAITSSLRKKVLAVSVSSVIYT